jgi:hypothetical protein
MIEVHHKFTPGEREATIAEGWRSVCGDQQVGPTPHVCIFTPHVLICRSLEEEVMSEGFC